LSNASYPDFTLIYGHTREIASIKTQGSHKGTTYVHEFGGGAVESRGLNAGTLIVFPDGKSVRLNYRSVLLVSDRNIWGYRSGTG